MKANTRDIDYFDFDTLRQFVLSIVPAQPIEYMVTKERQEKEVESLSETLGSRRFFFVTNLEHFEVEQAHGIGTWLGYRDEDFTMKKYLSIVHPGRRKSLIMVAVQLYSALCEGTYQLNFMVQRYSSQVILKHYNGDFWLANKISSVFQFDKKNRLTAYLNEFTITGRFDNQPMEPGFFTSTGEPEHRGEQILQQTIEKFLKLGVFTDREFQVARHLAYSCGSTKNQIAETLNISNYTVDEYGKRFLNKARVFFHKDFASVLDAAIYTKKEGLL